MILYSHNVHLHAILVLYKTQDGSRKYRTSMNGVGSMMQPETCELLVLIVTSLSDGALYLVKYVH